MYRLLFVLIFFNNSFFFAQDTKFVVPESEFQQIRLINKLEEEITTIHNEQKDWKLVQTILVDELSQIKQISLTQIEKVWQQYTAEEITIDELIDEIENALSLRSTINIAEIHEIAPKHFLLNTKAQYPKSISLQNNSILIGLSDKEEQRILNTFAIEKIKADQQKVISSIDNALTEVRKRLLILQKEVAVIERNIMSIYDKKQENNSIHRIAIWFGIPAFCITILVLFLVPSYWAYKKGKDAPKILNKKTLLDVATVFLLTTTILILGLAKMITGEVLGTLLGGISGYVLNRTIKKNSN
ncbi:hypothetical protein [Aquimarina rhabdastrellae]